MNVYRLVADMSHLFAILFLLFKICKSRSCAGISGKSQLLLLMVFVSRYLDLFTNFVSYYNTFMKLVFIGSTGLTVILIYVVYKSTYDSEHDTLHLVFLLVPVAGLAFYLNYEFTFLEVMWTFSIYLEAVAILPQFFMIRKTGEMEMFTYHYLFALGLYRAFYIFNWVYRYSHEGFFDPYAFWAGCVQTAFYCYFLYTKEFLKRQARTYFKLYASEEELAELERGDEKILILSTEGELEEKTSLALNQHDSIVVQAQEDDDLSRVAVPSDPQERDTAQPDVAQSSQDSHHEDSVTPSGREPSVGEDASNVSVQLAQA